MVSATGTFVYNELISKLHILESIHINTNRPEINNNQFATTVNMLDIT